MHSVFSESIPYVFQGIKNVYVHLGLVKNAGCHEKVQLHGNIAQKIDFLGAFWRMVATHGDNTHVEVSFKNTDSQVEKCKSQ